MKVFVPLASIFLLILFGAYFLTSYRSAFEADQACHAEKWNRYQDAEEVGCDHDLETKQWILYEVAEDHDPAVVIRRFRY